MIITDGAITDQENAIDNIVELSEYPCSIIIIGVGEANFRKMKKLDSDEAPLYSKLLKRYSKRDIVQFVKFKDFENDSTKLAAEVLREVPQQLVNYYQGKDIAPGEFANKKANVLRRNMTLHDTMKNHHSHHGENTVDAFYARASEKGLNVTTVKEFVKRHSIAAMNFDLLKQIYKLNDDYSNELKVEY